MQKIFFDANSDQSLISLYNNIKTSDIGEDVKKKKKLLFWLTVSTLRHKDAWFIKLPTVVLTLMSADYIIH